MNDEGPPNKKSPTDAQSPQTDARVGEMPAPNGAIPVPAAQTAAAATVGPSVPGPPPIAPRAPEGKSKRIGKAIKIVLGTLSATITLIVAVLGYLNAIGRWAARPTITLRYDGPSQDGTPYGFVYLGSEEHPRKILALPDSIQEMHASLSLTTTGSFDDRPVAGDVSTKVKASYSVVIQQESSVSATVEGVQLIADSTSSMPDRFVAVWDRKGLIERQKADVRLRINQKQYAIYTADSTAYYLAPHEAFPLRVSLIDADPGIYSLHAVATVTMRGATSTISSESVEVAMPRSQTNCGFELLSRGGDDESVARKLLALSPRTFDSLCRKYDGRYPYVYEIEQELTSLMDMDASPGDPTRFRSPDDGIFDHWKRSLGRVDGARAFAEEYGLDEALTHLRDFVRDHPEAAESRLALVELLIKRGDRTSAASTVAAFAKAIPESSLAWRATYELNGNAANLEKMVELAPDDPDAYLFIMEEHLRARVPVPPSFAGSKNHLTSAQRETVVDDVLVRMLDENEGLLFEDDDLRLLGSLDPTFRTMLLVTVSGAYENAFKGFKDPLLDQKTQLGRGLRVRAANVLAGAGRLVAAAALATDSGDGRTEATTLALMHAYEELIALPKRRAPATLSATEYLFVGLAMLRKRDVDGLRQLLVQYQGKFPKQTLILRSDEAGMRGDWAVAKTRMAGYVTAFEPEVATSAEELYFDLRNHRRIWLKLQALNDRSAEGCVLADLAGLSPRYSRERTRWPREYFFDRDLSGPDEALVRLDAYRHLNVDLTSDAVHFVRMPNILVPMAGTHVPETGYFHGLDTAKELASLANGARLLSSRVYLAKLSKDQIDASESLHAAWAEYWNNGAPEKALPHLARALERDPVFYDALLLRAQVRVQLGLFAEAAADFSAARKVAPLSPIDERTRLKWAALAAHAAR